MNFLSRQRRAVKYSHKYVITHNDTKRDDEEKDKHQDTFDIDPNADVAKLLEGFDPINNQQDRRILFEVTGMRLHNDEFQGDSSDDSELDETSQELLPIDYAFMERFYDGDDDTGQ